MDIYELFARVLVDSEATHSFISIVFAEKLDKILISIDSLISVLTPSGKVIASRYSFKAYPIKIEDRVLFADLVILDIYDFDVILGMDWLCKYYANIDCHKKIVFFQPPSELSFILEFNLICRSL